MKINLIKLNMLIICFTTVVFGSCLGVSADITIKADGSGKIALEYRVSQTLESLGRLDGNESRPVVPVGKADFERTISRIPGLKLSKYSSKEIKNSSGGKDLVTNATLDFKDTGALLAFLDSSGSHATLAEEGGAGKILRLNLLDPSQTVTNPDLLALLKEVSSPYEMSLSFNLPKNADIKMIPSAIPAAKIEAKGKKATFSIGMAELLSLSEGLALEIRW